MDNKKLQGYKKYIRIGKIRNTHGTKGEVKVLPLSEYRERYSELNWVYLEDSDSTCLKIENIRWHGELLIIKFKNIDSMEEAEKLKNRYICIDETDVVKLPEGRYYFFEILGLRVYDINGTEIGEIVDILETGANDVYIVKQKPGDKEILIPALKEVVKDISLDKGKVTVDLPEGLVE